MLDIDYLITLDINHLINELSTVKQKTELLLNLTEYEIYFPDLCDNIAKYWYSKTGTPYISSEHYIGEADKSFILDYAESVNNLDKVKRLINKLGSCSDGVYDYDEIIAQAENEINTIRIIDDFDFSDAVLQYDGNNKKPTINSLLGFNPHTT